jgi:hypothetical protein
MVVNRVNYYSWFLRVFAWDGMMPVFIIIVPFLINFFFPNFPAAMNIAGLSLPLVGFFVRLALGIRHIRANTCSELVSGVQFIFFIIGIFCLVLIDVMLILLHEMPAGVLFPATSDYIAFGATYLIYLVAMIIAMYPGRTISPKEERFEPVRNFGQN